MRARALLRTESTHDAAGRPRTRLAVLRSEAPLKLRPLPAHGGLPWSRTEDIARVCLAAGAAGPMGGDELRLDIRVGAGSSLVLTEASATLLLPGVGGAASSIRVGARVEAGATFVWLPEPVIAARACHHVTEVAVDLCGDARLLLREELLLGRRGEGPGRLRQSTSVRRDGEAVHVQDLRIGTVDATSPAVLGRHRAVGSLLVADPELTLGPVSVPLGDDGILMPLARGNAALAHALGADSIQIRRQLDAALRSLGAPWRNLAPTERSTDGEPR